MSVCCEKDNIRNKKNKREVTPLEATYTVGFELSFDSEWGEGWEGFLLGQRLDYFNCLAHSKLFIMMMNSFS